MMEKRGFQDPAYAASEVTRYLGWPGQAISYKVGQRAILEIREELKKKKGAAFSLKDFHARVLGSGPVGPRAAARPRAHGLTGPAWPKPSRRGRSTRAGSSTCSWTPSGSPTATSPTSRSSTTPGAAAVLPFVGQGDVLLVRQFRHAAGGYLLEIPAGKLDQGEAPEACARRETAEEIGQRVGRLEKLGSILTTPGFTDEVIHLFAGYDLVPTAAALEPDEDLTVVRMSFAEALARVEQGEITDAKSMATILLAARARDVATRP